MSRFSRKKMNIGNKNINYLALGGKRKPVIVLKNSNRSVNSGPSHIHSNRQRNVRVRTHFNQGVIHPEEHQALERLQGAQRMLMGEDILQNPNERR